MINQMQQSVKSCMHCLQHEGDLPKVPLHPIVATAPMDLLHEDLTTTEMTLELNRLPKVVNILVFQDHFMKHVMAYVTPNHTAKTVAKFLYQGYISIFGAPAMLLSNQGANFMSSIIDKMCKVLGMKKLQNHTVPHTDKWVGGEITSNHDANDWEAGRRQKGKLARTSG